MDNQPIPVSSVPSEYLDIDNSSFRNFTNIYSHNQVPINWGNGIFYTYDYKDLLFFETTLAKGEHLIRVEYTSKAWINLRSWVKEYSVVYSLLPAQYWR